MPENDNVAACREAVSRFQDHGFRITAEQYEPKHFGNLVINLASRTLEIRLTRDRGQHFIDVRRPDDTEWFDAYVLLTFIGLREEAEALARGGWRSPDEVARSVSSHFETIAVSFEDARYSETKKALRQIERDSAFSRFGYVVP